MTLPDVTTYSDSDLALLAVAVSEETARRAALTTLPAEISDRITAYETAGGWDGHLSSLPGVDDTHTTEDGTVYRSLIPHNITLPGVGPVWWMYWTRVGGAPEPDPETGAIPWSGEGVTYTVDQLVTHEGATYRVRQPHTSQPLWTPPMVPALYELVETP